MRSPLFAPLMLLAMLTVEAAEIPQRTVVRFNTACARCHEGECSGRMTFNLDHAAAANHMRRHAGDVTTDEQKDLHALLAYMKQRCAYYPMRPPRAGGWDRPSLARLRNPAGDAHFIPLGMLAAGRYRVRLHFDAAAEACAQIISASFEISERPGLKTENQGMEFEFATDESLLHYLRLQTAAPAVLDSVEIRPLR